MTRSADAPPPLAVILMGVSGSGKTTVGRLLAERIGAEFAEGDKFHPPANVAKMRSGQPLDDADRLPWLAAMARAIEGWLADGKRVVLACSALKRSYRRLLGEGRPGVVIVYLKGSQELIARRLAARKGHFMPATLLPSQFAALEEPAADEACITVDIAGTPAEIVDQITAALARWPAPAPGSDAGIG